MLTPKENFYETIKKGGKPDRLVNLWEPFQPIMNDPLQKFTRGNRERGKNTRDKWGTMISWPAEQHAAMPHVTADDKVLPDIEKWRDYVKVPNLLEYSNDWSDAFELSDSAKKDGKVVVGFMGTGCFEQLHYLMGFEDTLMNFLIEPEAMHELCAAIGEYRLTYAKLLVDNLKPDMILSHDDWGSKNSLFMSPEVWREFIKPLYVPIYKYMKDNGVLVMHHADSYLEPIIGDMVELGVDIWQGVLPTNNVPKMQAELAGRMTLMGGVDSWVDRRESTEDELRAEARRVCETYGPAGHFIPGLSYGGPGSIFPHVDPVLRDEIALYNERVYGIKA